MSQRAREELRKKFPNLAREWGGRGTIRINAVRSSPKEAEKATYTFQGYEPTVIDFVRRCDTEEQALEIINFFEGNGKIESNYARRLRNQLVRRGVRSFGSKKGPGYYEQG